MPLTFVPPACPKAGVHIERKDVLLVAVVHSRVVQSQPE